MKMKQYTKTTMSLAAAMGTLALASSASAALSITNGGFEDTTVADGASDTSVTSWFEEAEGASLGAFVFNPSATIEPNTPSPVGNNWLELISDSGVGGVVYQQIDNFVANQTITISMLVGNRNRSPNPQLGDTDYAVELWAGGTVGSAATGTSLTALGATMIDTSGTVVIVGNGQSETKSFDLDTGSSFTGSDAVWLRITQVAQSGGIGANNVVLFDDITATSVPEPSTTALLGLGGLALILRRRK
jgi:hypothetical protein